MARKPLNKRLFFVTLAKNFARFRIYEMQSTTGQTGGRLISVLRQFPSGEALDIFARVRATENKGGQDFRLG
jgi:hypothetical protein